MTTWRKLTRMPCLFRLFLGFGGGPTALFTLPSVLSETVEPRAPSKGPSSTVNFSEQNGSDGRGSAADRNQPMVPYQGSQSATQGSRLEAVVSQGV